MSSMLVIPPQSAYTSTRGQVRSRSYNYPKPLQLDAGRKRLGEVHPNGLPTPPSTADMDAASISNGVYAYQHHYPYMTEQRSTTITDPDKWSVPNSAAGTLRTSEYISKAQSHGHEKEEFGYSIPVTKSQQEDQIASHLQIPESINNSKGSLAEFAAEMTCLFWFETSPTLEYAEALPTSQSPDRGLALGAIPSIGFRKWVTTMLSTTQVGKNVILLAIMFIYRLKKFNPGVSGKMGSEFRLLTIALMLGNKFLDDNTYTNKTWAEVSGISVNEIHIMEVEFLSNMRYELYASEAQWEDWKSKLGRFGSFYEKASRCINSKAMSPVTPVTQTAPHKLPSPPSGTRFTNSPYPGLPHPLHTLPQLPRSPTRRLPGIEHPFERKRSLDTSVDIPSAKRVRSSHIPATNVSPSALTPMSVLTPDSSNTAYSYEGAPRLPQLPMPTLPNPALWSGGQPGPRAMSSVYHPTTSLPQQMVSSTNGQTTMPALPVPNSGATSNSWAPSHASSVHTSPTNLYGMSTPTRPGLSPSYFLMNRSSPYRPVRHVNTLLYPPPSAAMQTPVKPIDYQQMHYQPLSKSSSETRSGPMPCLQPDAWQSRASTPNHGVYRPY